MHTGFKSRITGEIKMQNAFLNTATVVINSAGNKKKLIAIKIKNKMLVPKPNVHS